MRVDSPINVIPNGSYCYDERGLCPYWQSTGKHFPYDALVEKGAVVGRCEYLGKDDLDLRYHPVLVRADGRSIPKDEQHEEDWWDYGLLWDQCKECEINEDGWPRGKAAGC